MISFEDHGTSVVLVYESELDPPAWLDEKLRSGGSARLARVFTVLQRDLVRPGSGDAEFGDTHDDARSFVVGEVGEEYRTIRKEVLGLAHDVLIAVSLPLTKSLFVAERGISILKRIDGLIDEPIVIGGNSEKAIPEADFLQLIQRFPTSTELRYYADARVTRVLKEYLETMSDAESRLDEYIERRGRGSRRVRSVGRISAANELELEKFIYVHDRLMEMLEDADSYSEQDWQLRVADLFLLIMPQYIAVLDNVHIKESYSKGSKAADRYVDLLLVRSNGSVDLIEIKKPFKSGLLSNRRYRDNHYPLRELSGSIMQAEKYLFYLNKSGKTGERRITDKRGAELPDGLDIKITNPKAIILAGRDNLFTEEQKLDFEVVRRTYSNVVDIITYDDLLRRLDNVITTVRMRVEADRESGA